MSLLRRERLEQPEPDAAAAGAISAAAAAISAAVTYGAATTTTAAAAASPRDELSGANGGNHLGAISHDELNHLGAISYDELGGPDGAHHGAQNEPAMVRHWKKNMLSTRDSGDFGDFGGGLLDSGGSSYSGGTVDSGGSVYRGSYHGGGFPDEMPRGTSESLPRGTSESPLNYDRSDTCPIWKHDESPHASTAPVTPRQPPCRQPTIRLSGVSCPAWRPSTICEDGGLESGFSSGFSSGRESGFSSGFSGGGGGGGEGVGMGMGRRGGGPMPPVMIFSPEGAPPSVAMREPRLSAVPSASMPGRPHAPHLEPMHASAHHGASSSPGGLHACMHASAQHGASSSPGGLHACMHAWHSPLLQLSSAAPSRADRSAPSAAVPASPAAHCRPSPAAAAAAFAAAASGRVAGAWQRRAQHDARSPGPSVTTTTPPAATPPPPPATTPPATTTPPAPVAAFDPAVIAAAWASANPDAKPADEAITAIKAITDTDPSDGAIKAIKAITARRAGPATFAPAAPPTAGRVTFGPRPPTIDVTPVRPSRTAAAAAAADCAAAEPCMQGVVLSGPSAEVWGGNELGGLLALVDEMDADANADADDDDAADDDVAFVEARSPSPHYAHDAHYAHYDHYAEDEAQSLSPDDRRREKVAHLVTTAAAAAADAHSLISLLDEFEAPRTAPRWTVLNEFEVLRPRHASPLDSEDEDGAQDGARLHSSSYCSYAGAAGGLEPLRPRSLRSRPPPPPGTAYRSAPARRDARSAPTEGKARRREPLAQNRPLAPITAPLRSRLQAW